MRARFDVQQAIQEENPIIEHLSVLEYIEKTRKKQDKVVHYVK